MRDRPPRPFVLVATCAVGAALAACASSAPHPASMAELTGTWQLAAGSAPGARIPTLSVAADGSISGTGGVNRYRGVVDATAMTEGRWIASGLGVERPKASTAEAMALEQQFFTAIARADRAVIAGDLLQLHRGDELLAVLRRSWLR